ncbi:MAG TPA: polysaccharide biosynthesis/export family protein [Hanamia sp.]|nr:polysaccharide biosynthesis/export family protein [Hanamia sp.]
MHKTFQTTIYLLFSFFLTILFASCASTRKVAYFNDVPDSTRILSKAGIEPVIQKKDILSITVSSLSNEATIIFNTPNLPITPSASITPGMPQTAGYLVSDDGIIKFPVLGDIPAAGLTQKQLENNITHLLIEKKLLFDPIVSSRFLNFRVTVLGEVNRPGVVTVPSEQISILEAIGEAGDLTIYGLRDNVILIRQEGADKLITRLNLSSSKILQSPYYFLKSNDVIYVEPAKDKIASTSLFQQRIPVILSGLSLIIILLTNVFKL